MNLDEEFVVVIENIFKFGFKILLIFFMFLRKMILEDFFDF